MGICFRLDCKTNTRREIQENCFNFSSFAKKKAFRIKSAKAIILMLPEIYSNSFFVRLSIEVHAGIPSRTVTYASVKTVLFFFSSLIDKVSGGFSLVQAEAFRMLSKSLWRRSRTELRSFRGDGENIKERRTKIISMPDTKSIEKSHRIMYLKSNLWLSLRKLWEFRFSWLLGFYLSRLSILITTLIFHISLPRLEWKGNWEGRRMNSISEVRTSVEAEIEVEAQAENLNLKVMAYDRL